MAIPKPPPIVYHYCSTEAAISILEGTVWLSSFTLSNDSREGFVGQEAVLSAAQRRNAGVESRDSLKERMRLLDQIYGCYGMCFSAHHDRLSQWRGYADDGAGFAIGFRTDLLQWMQLDLDVPLHYRTSKPDHSSMTWQPVLYEQDDHLAAAATIYDAVATPLEILKSEPADYADRLRQGPPGMNQEKFKALGAMSDTLLMNFPRMYAMKGEAFREEAEWRAIAVVINETGNFHFRKSRGRVVPYIVHKLPQEADKNPIVKIVLGPKNSTPRYVVELLAGRLGIDTTDDITHSEASYQ